MATSTPGAQKPASTTKRSTTRRKPASATARAGRATSASRTAPRTTLAERAVLVPVGASLVASDSLVSTVKGLASKYRSRSNLERELKRYERRGVTARNRFERQIRRARTRFERDVRENRRRVGRELSSVRRDFEKSSGAVGARVDRLVSDAQGLIGS
ncbi:MAG: hypothetical protein JO363_18390 [Solirubrobacterales bacterium]|nr:hypothetical protein [Solirubrobacterales bacterium]